MNCLIAYLVFAALTWALVDYAARHAPEGWQDENGFHLGKHP